jgi:phosphatidylserine/phosphatidylglycerophosphate/cardiolipin synthase-like enzyme
MANGAAVSSQILNALNNATSSIKIAHAHFRTPEIYQAVKKAHERGVVVKIVLDQQEYRPGSEFANNNLFFEELLIRQNVDVRYKVFSVKWSHTTAKQMHSKFSIIDNKTVLTGSYNWSENAETNTFENMVVINDAAAVQKYINQFDVISNYRASEYNGLIATLTQNRTAADCHMDPMTMTAKQFDNWRDLFPASMCQ